jgi:hypothetical protein
VKLRLNLDSSGDAVGALLGEVRIIGSNLAGEGVGTTAFGQPHNQGTINANYEFPWLPALSADITVLPVRRIIAFLRRGAKSAYSQ